jgi:hypothetical protein
MIAPETGKCWGIWICTDDFDLLDSVLSKLDQLPEEPRSIAGLLAELFQRSACESLRLLAGTANPRAGFRRRIRRLHDSIGP